MLIQIVVCKVWHVLCERTLLLFQNNLLWQCWLVRTSDFTACVCVLHFCCFWSENIRAPRNRGCPSPRISVCQHSTSLTCRMWTSHSQFFSHQPPISVNTAMISQRLVVFWFWNISFWHRKLFTSTGVHALQVGGEGSSKVPERGQSCYHVRPRVFQEGGLSMQRWSWTNGQMYGVDSWTTSNDPVSDNCFYFVFQLTLICFPFAAAPRNEKRCNTAWSRSLACQSLLLATFLSCEFTTPNDLSPSRLRSNSRMPTSESRRTLTRKWKSSEIKRHVTTTSKTHRKMYGSFLIQLCA